MESIAATSASEVVYLALRQAIVDRTLLPGERLSRQSLAERYSTSQTPVREALLRLEQEGLVHVRPQAGTHVTGIDIAGVHQAQFLRRCLEERVVEQLAARGSIDLTALRASAASGAFDAADLAFHRALFAAVGMEALFRNVVPLLAPLERCAHLRSVTDQTRQITTQEHSDILDRIAAGDAKGAAAAMAAHLATEVQDLAELQAAHPEMFTRESTRPNP
ncbi:MAG: GntR family transcriptional regulator [Pseudomonadota bacterium]